MTSPARPDTDIQQNYIDLAGDLLRNKLGPERLLEILAASWKNGATLAELALVVMTTPDITDAIKFARDHRNDERFEPLLCYLRTTLITDGGGGRAGKPEWTKISEEAFARLRARLKAESGL